MNEFKTFKNYIKENNVESEVKNTQDDLFDEIIEEADIAFWNVITKSFPEITTGDFPIDAHVEFQVAQEKAVKTWIDFNKK
jgi:hypothetical protein